MLGKPWPCLGHLVVYRRLSRPKQCITLHFFKEGEDVAWRWLRGRQLPEASTQVLAKAGQTILEVLGSGSRPLT